jgi:GTP pyrophosphokinase
MVSTRRLLEKQQLSKADHLKWYELLKLERSIEDSPKFIAALALIAEHQGKTAQANHELLQQALDMTQVLASMNLDDECLAATCLYCYQQKNAISIKQINDRLGPKVKELIAGVSKMSVVRNLQSRSTADVEANKVAMDPIRHMLLAMVDDVRVILIKLAEQLALLEQAKNKPKELRLQLALETREIYAPLANRLGIGHIKWELEDYAFRYTEPEQYKTIAKALAEKRKARDRYIKKVLDIIQDELAKINISAEISGRAKHIYSIYRKMQRKNVAFDEIYDARAVRILVNQVPECYAALGVVHSLWRHIPKEFDDYIATPKENGYQSIHTAVIGPEGKALEVQIRTHQMHQDSEHGVAAHWKYKEGSKQGEAVFEQKIAWLRELLEWQEEIADSEELLNDFREQVVEDRVYVFTPAGEIIDLPPKATPLDFAYSIHTEVGHRCRGAKVNGRIVPLTYELTTGEQVEVLTAKNSMPSRDWMNAAMGYIKSSRTRAKVHQFFKRLDKDKNALAGKSMLEKELQRQGAKQVDLKVLAKAFNFNSSDELYAAVGAGDVKLHQVGNSARQLVEAKRAKQDKEYKSTQPQFNEPSSLVSNKKAPSAEHDGISIQGVDNLLTHTAGCCKPIPGDDIVGYISKLRGVVVHRADCSHVLKAQSNNPERLISAEWGSSKEYYQADIEIQAYDRQGLLRDVTTLLANHKVGVVSLNTNSRQITDMKIEIELQIEVESRERLSEILIHLNQIPNIAQAKRR